MSFIFWLPTDVTFGTQWHEYAEMGAVMKALGAKDAINLDGGGSSTFIIRSKAGFEENRFAIRNWPYDNGGVERAVANGLLVVTDN